MKSLCAIPMWVIPLAETASSYPVPVLFLSSRACLGQSCIKLNDSILNLPWIYEWTIKKMREASHCMRFPGKLLKRPDSAGRTSFSKTLTFYAANNK